MDRSWFRSLGLAFPAVRSDDLAMMPFVYGRAEAVYYDSAIAVHYRLRPGSVSESPLTIDMLLSYEALLREILMGLDRDGLSAMGADLSLKFNDNLFFWMQRARLKAGAAHQSIHMLLTILNLVSGSRSAVLMRDVLVRLQQAPIRVALPRRWMQAIVPLLPANLLLDHVQQRLVEWQSGGLPCEVDTAMMLCQLLLALPHMTSPTVAPPTVSQPPKRFGAPLGW